MAKDRQKAQTGSAKTGNPISDEDLEEYGVWVKAEPQDIPEAASDSPEEAPFEIPVMDISEDVTEISEESFLTEEEESLLGSVDSEATDETEEVSVEEVDFSIDSVSGTDSFERKPGKSIPPKEALSFNTDEDFSLDDIPEMTETLSPGSGESSGEEEISLEDFGISDSSRPQVSGAGETEMSFEEFGKGGSSRSEEFDEGSEESEAIDLDLQFDDTIESESAGGRGGSSHTEGVETEEVTDFDDFLKESEDSKAAVPKGSAKKKKAASPAVKDAGFDDIAAFEDELSSEAHEGKGGGNDLSTALLLRIAEELGSIKEELSSLKSQLVSVQQERPATEAPKGEATEQDKQQAGFFEEEEDETIALTGDELDNILNTADFTEEAGEAQAGESLSEDIAAGMLSATPDIVPETEAPVEEISLDEEPRPLGIHSKGSLKDEVLDELAPIHEEGVEPMTSPPEDTSYLDEEAENLLGEISLEEVPLEEPDLSSISLEDSNLLEENEELPAADGILEDLTLDIGEDVEELSLASEEPFAEELSLESFEEASSQGSGSREISLADETREDRGAKLVGQTLKKGAPEKGQTEIAPTEGIPEIEELGFESEAEMPEFLPTEMAIPEEAPAEIEADFAPRASDIPLPSLDEELIPDFSEKGEEIELSEEVVLEDDAGIPSDVSISIHPDDVSMNLSEDLFVGKPAVLGKGAKASKAEAPIPGALKDEIKSVLAYMDKLLESLPEEKIEEFAKSEHFEIYKKLFEELGLV